MHKQSSRSEWANKPTKDKWKKPGRWEKTWKLKKRKEPNQMESMANTASVWNGCSSQGRLRCLGHKRLNQVWWHGARVVCVCLCVRVCCVGGRIWHPVSKLACDGEGTLRFQGYFVFLYSYRISLYSQLDFILLILVALWKKSYFFTNRIVLFFFNCFFFSEKTNICFFFLHLLSKQS